jgi:hypothetical protein
LESSFNPEASKIVERIKQGKEILLDHASLAFFGGGVAEKEPTTFDESWNHDDPRTQEKWREVINIQISSVNFSVFEVAAKTISCQS